MTPWCLYCQQEMVAVFSDSAVPSHGDRLYAYSLFHCASDGTLCKRDTDRPHHMVWLFANGAVLVFPQPAQADAHFTRRFSLGQEPL
jgi:hypothetical protein